MDEEWRPIAGYEGLYDVSNLGRVRSHDRWVTRRNGKQVRWNGRILKPNRGSKGHYRVNLFKDGTPTMAYIHQIVARAFVQNPESRPLVRHLDDVKENNRADNLAWGTHSDNRKDALRNGVKYGPDTSLRTHCKNGHLFDEGNTRWYRGSRVCRKCKREWARNKSRLISRNNK